ncbi:MAG: methylated-DNA--[protein]-cysteine S-methyltransferase [Anaerovoracaceae bacterium]
MYYTTDYNTPIGKLILASDDRGEFLTGAWFEGQKYFGGTAGHELIKNNNLGVFEDAKSWLDRYFNGDKPSPSELPLAPCGSEFRQMVWQLLCEIPYGEVTTYGKLAAEAARRMGRERMSAQAIGGAVGHNPISVIIPCHRVIGTDGSLTGYAGGIELKKWLLMHEGCKFLASGNRPGV